MNFWLAQAFERTPSGSGIDLMANKNTGFFRFDKYFSRWFRSIWLCLIWQLQGQWRMGHPNCRTKVNDGRLVWNPDRI